MDPSPDEWGVCVHGEADSQCLRTTVHVAVKWSWIVGAILAALAAACPPDATSWFNDRVLGQRYPDAVRNVRRIARPATLVVVRQGGDERCAMRDAMYLVVDEHDVVVDVRDGRNAFCHGDILCVYKDD